MEYTTKNIAGITTVFAPLADANSTTIQVLVKAGSIYETRNTNGLSHFLEHMFFKWGKKYTTPKMVAETLDSFGADYNAFTGSEYAGYYVKCAPEYFPQAVDVLADMLVHSAFPKAEIETEKWVVVQEIAMYEDNPQRQVWTKQNQRYYGDNAYGWPILWPVENVMSFTQDDLMQHKSRLYTKDNLVIVVAGNIQDQAKIEEQIESLFGDLWDTTSWSTPVYPDHKPSTHQGSFTKETQQNHLVITIPWFSTHDDQRFAAKILTKILWWGMSSRLFQNIREKKWLCYYIWATHSSADVDGNFYLYAGMDKANRDQWLEAITHELDRITNWDITEDEFAKALWNIRWSTQMGIETSDQLADFIGYQQLFKGEIRWLDEVLVDYEKVSLDEVNNLGQKFSQENVWSFWVE